MKLPLGRQDSLPESKFFEVLDTIVPGENLASRAAARKPRIYFTRLAMSGLEEMHEYSVSDKRFYDHLEYEPFKSLDDTRAYLQRLLDLEGKKHGRTAIGWFIRTSEDHKVVGSARFVNLDYKRQSVAWGYGLDPRLWGQGYVQEVQRTLLDYIFNTLRLNRIHGTAAVDNKQTISTLVSIGMKEEGIHRQAMRDHHGNYHDSWSYAMLYEDYRDSKAWIPCDPEAEAPQGASTSNVDPARVGARLSDFLKEYGDVAHEAALAELPYWDSLKQMELVSFLETEFQVSFSIDQIIGLTSIRAVIQTMCPKK